MSKFARGYTKDTADPNDYGLEEHPTLLTVGLPRLPSVVDLRSLMSPIRDQGQLGACTAFAWCALMESLLLQTHQPLTMFSPLELYYEERAMEGDIVEDAGAQLRTGAKVLKAQGVCPEMDDPYDITQFTTAPTPAALADAASHRITAYYRVSTLRQLKRTLAWGHPTVIGVDVYESFEADSTIATGNVPMPEPGEQLLGGHAICACGYDDATQTVLIHNSWSDQVGDKGYFRLPYGFWSAGITTDMWTAV